MNEKKTVTVKHKKSFANTRTGQSVDRAIAGAVTVAGGMFAAYAISFVKVKIEEMELDKDVKKLFKEAKTRYENRV